MACPPRCSALHTLRVPRLRARPPGSWKRAGCRAIATQFAGTNREKNSCLFAPSNIAGATRWPVRGLLYSAGNPTWGSCESSGSPKMPELRRASQGAVAAGPGSAGLPEYPSCPFADVLIAGLGRTPTPPASHPAPPSDAPVSPGSRCSCSPAHGDCTAFCLKNLRFREPPARMGPAHHPISAYPRVPPPPLRPRLTVGSSGSSRPHHPPGPDPVPVGAPPSSGTRYRARTSACARVTLSALQNQPDLARFPKQGRANHSQSGAYGRSRPCRRTSMPPPGRARQLQERGSQTRPRVRRERPGAS